MNSSNNENPKKEHWIITVLNELRHHSLSIIFIVVLFLLFWVVPQINDLIIVINQEERDWLAVIMFFSALGTFAFLIGTVNNFFPEGKESDKDNESDVKMKTKKFNPLSWRMKMPKDAKEIYLESKTKGTYLDRVSGFHEDSQAYVKRMFPKILGAIFLLSTAYAVANIYQDVYGDTIFIGGRWGLVVGIGLLLLSLNKSWIAVLTKWFQKAQWTLYIPIVIAAGSFVTIVVLGGLNRGGSDGDARRLFYALLLLTVFFLTVTVSYNPLVKWFKKNIGVPLITFLVLFCFISYIVLCINPRGMKFLSPLTIVMVCIIGIYALANVLRYLGRHWNIPLLGMVLLLCVLLANFAAKTDNFTHYEATSVSVKVRPEERPSLEAYTKEWVKDRRTDILNSTSKKPFPIILVAAEGGGSRAGLWSLLVQGYLYERNPDYFKKHLFSMTGASGGGVGNGVFYTQATRLAEGDSPTSFSYTQKNKDSFRYRASSFYTEDYLSTSVAGILGRDLFKSITNAGNYKDRGALLEEEWEEAFTAVYNNGVAGKSPLAEPYLNRNLDTLSSYIPPLWITNTTHLQSGERAVISPVCILDDHYNMNVFMDFLDAYPKQDSMIKRSTAMSMNARFPYLSPVARVVGLGQFGDAGYYDNIGGTVTRRLGVALLRELKKDSLLNGKYRIKNLVISNYEKPWNDGGDITYNSQLTAPASIIWNATFAHPKEMEKTFMDRVVVQSRRTSIKERETMLNWLGTSKEKNPVRPIIPLGRYLSNAAAQSMEKRLRSPSIQAALNALIPAHDTRN